MPNQRSKEKAFLTAWVSKKLKAELKKIAREQGDRPVGEIVVQMLEMGIGMRNTPIGKLVEQALKEQEAKVTPSAPESSAISASPPALHEPPATQSSSDTPSAQPTPPSPSKRRRRK